MIRGIVPALAEGGKIKIGGLGETRQSKGGGTYRVPLKLDHFLITRTTRDTAGDLEIDADVMAALKKDADGQVREIPIVLHSDAIDDVFPTTYALYAGKRLACRGDGVAAIRWEMNAQGQRTGKTTEMKCPCPYLGATSGPICKPHGTLHCSIALPGVAVAGVVHKWRTTSIISIQRMIGSLQQILSLCGTLRGVPLWLRVEPVTVAPAGAPPSTVYCCHVELRAADVLAVQQQALRVAELRRALNGGVEDPAQYRLLLAPPAGDQETVEEQAEVADEFHSEAEAVPAAPRIMVPQPKAHAPAPAPAPAHAGPPPPPAPPEAPAQPPPAEPGLRWTGLVEHMDSKTGDSKGRKWVCYFVIVAGHRFGTFSESDAAVASSALANKTIVGIRWEKTDKGERLLSIEPLEDDDTIPF